MPAIIPLLTLLLVSHDEVAQLIVKSGENSRYFLSWKDFTLARKSYFEASYVHEVRGGISYNGLRLSYTVNGSTVFLKVGDDEEHTISIVALEEAASTFEIIPDGAQGTTGSSLERFLLGYHTKDSGPMTVHMDYDSDGTARVHLKPQNTQDGDALTCISICRSIT